MHIQHTRLFLCSTYYVFCNHLKILKNNLWVCINCFFCSRKQKVEVPTDPSQELKSGPPLSSFVSYSSIQYVPTTSFYVPISFLLTRAATWHRHAEASQEPHITHTPWNGEVQTCSYQMCFPLRTQLAKSEAKQQYRTCHPVFSCTNLVTKSCLLHVQTPSLKSTRFSTICDCLQTAKGLLLNLASLES